VRGQAVGGIVLAAGEATRMGGLPKALIQRDGVALVRRVALALLNGGAGEVVVVLGHWAEEIWAAVEDLPLRGVVNPIYREGRESSLRAGLHALRERCDAVAVALADQPLLESPDVREVLRAFERRSPHAAVVVPRALGRRGHPVLLESRVSRDILAHAPGFSMREWIAEHPAEVEWFDADHARFVTDVDTPQDVARIAQQHGCTMRLPG
jgi:CTP:molybdopterin cytidylyltransferase MocA